MFETLHPYQVSFFWLGPPAPCRRKGPKTNLRIFLLRISSTPKNLAPHPPQTLPFLFPYRLGGPLTSTHLTPPPPLPDPAFLFQALLLLTPQQAASPTMVLPSLPTKYPILPNWHGMTRGLSTSNSTHPAPTPTTSFPHPSTGWQTTALQLVLEYSPCVCWTSMLPGLGFSSPKPSVLQLVLEVPEFHSPWPKSLVLL